MAPPQLVVVGGGASGMFAATAAARRGLRVTVLEQGAAPLRKVLASGGGRCNVMHDVQPPHDLVRNYPRGERELLGPFSSRFTPNQTREWFEREGVQLKVEADGRVFPVTDDAETIAASLRRAAAAAGVRTVLGAKVTRVAAAPTTDGSEPRFELAYQDKRAGRATIELECSALLLATGSAAAGYVFARELGHTLTSPYPSLFSFRVPDIERTALAGLAGLVLPGAAISLEVDDSTVSDDSSTTTTTSSSPATLLRGQQRQRRHSSRRGGGTPLTQRGSLLITHRGLSGPAALRLSAFGAAELHQAQYRGRLLLNSLDAAAAAADDESPGTASRRRRKKQTAEKWCLGQLQDYARAHAAQQLVSTRSAARPFEAHLPKRWWASMVNFALLDGGRGAHCTVHGTARGVRESARHANSGIEDRRSRSTRSTNTTNRSPGHGDTSHGRKRWADLRTAELESLATALTTLPLQFSGQDTNKDEFVSAGGVPLSDVDMRTMESKRVPGLYFSGELLDVDGVTGGFNFQAAWTTGHVAGEAAATKVSANAAA